MQNDSEVTKDWYAADEQARRRRPASRRAVPGTEVVGQRRKLACDQVFRAEEQSPPLVALRGLPHPDRASRPLSVGMGEGRRVGDASVAAVLHLESPRCGSLTFFCELRLRPYYRRSYPYPSAEMERSYTRDRILDYCDRLTGLFPAAPGESPRHSAPVDGPVLVLGLCVASVAVKLKKAGSYLIAEEPASLPKPAPSGP